MAIQVRRGKEDELDISKAVPGEWLVSTDTRIVRMCVAPGIVLRMATYEAFEADTQKFIEQMEQILSETKTVQEAVERIQNEIEDSVITVENYVESAKGYSNLSNTYAMQSKMYAEESNNYADDSYNEAERAKMYAENAEAVTNVKIASQTEAGLMRGGENYVDESGTLVLTKQTTDATLYNSYSGGLKIDRIAGASKQNQYTGKNLFDVSEFKYFDSSTTTIEEINCDTGYIKITFENAASLGGVYTGHILNIIDGKTYIASVNNITNVSGINCIVQALDAETGEWIANYTLGKTFTASSEYMYRFVIQNNTGAKYSGTVEVDSIQLELGSVATDYEPYVGGIPSPNPDYPQEIQSVEVSEIKAHGKNLIPYPYHQTTFTANGLTFTDNGDGTITVNGTATARTFFNLANWSDDHMILETGNYIFSGCPSGGGSSTYGLGSADHNNMNFVMDWGDGKAFTMDEKNQRGAYIVVSSGATLDNVVFKPMIRRADVDDDAYEPYQESVATLSEAVTLHGINDVKDRIVQKDGALCIERNLAEVVLDGSETWTLGSVDNLFRTTVVAGISPKAITAMLSDSYICSMKSVANMPDKTIRQSVTADSTTAVTHIKDSSYTTVDELTAALAENPVRCIVMRAEPTYESLPVADQIALMSLKTFDTVTYISTDSDIEPVIDVEYGTSRIGGYTLEALNTAQKNEIQYASLATLTNSLATALVAGSEE